jgi:Helicase subunit of the DNA excision repair complex
MRNKEGILGGGTLLDFRPIGRAARHVEGGSAFMPTTMTDSMAKAIEETERRRKIQQAYNDQHGIVPTAAGKKASNSI